jgi:hypothetical protein
MDYHVEETADNRAHNKSGNTEIIDSHPASQIRQMEFMLSHRETWLQTSDDAGQTPTKG